MRYDILMLKLNAKIYKKIFVYYIKIKYFRIFCLFCSLTNSMNIVHFVHWRLKWIFNSFCSLMSLMSCFINMNKSVRFVVMLFYIHWNRNTSMHLMTLTSNGVILTSHWIVSTFDDIDIKCNSDNFINRRLLAGIWPFHDWMQQFWHHIQSSVHLMTSASNAAILTSHSIVNAFNDIDIKCSFDNFINKQLSACIWSFHDQMQQFWHHIQSSVHLLTSTSNAAFLTTTVCLCYNLIAASHLFDRFFISSKNCWSVLYIFIWSNFIKKTHQS